MSRLIISLLCLSSLVIPTHQSESAAVDGDDDDRTDLPAPPDSTLAPLFVFGDSLYDPGNNNYIDTTHGNRANFLPYGQTHFQFATGRFSDGRVVPDFIAKYAKLPFIPPYFQSGYRQFRYGVNFASGGGGALVETHPGKSINLKQQLIYFKEMKEEVRKWEGDEATQQLLSKAVFIFSIGVNDLGSKDPIFSSFSTLEYIDIVLGNVSAAVKEIYEAGGRKFGFMSLPLGCFPADRNARSDSSCDEDLAQVSKLYNLGLSMELKRLQMQLREGGFMYSLFDFFTVFNQWIRNPSKFGFKEVKSACCGSGKYRGIFSCGGKRVEKNYELCPNPNQYLFFDSFHPSEKAQEMMAELMWDGPPSITAPYTLKHLFDIANWA